MLYTNEHSETTPYIKSFVLFFNQVNLHRTIILPSFTDLGCKRSLDWQYMSVKPSAFLLPANSRQTVMMVLHPGEQQAVMCHEKAAIVAAMAFLYGDEVARQKYRR